MLDCWSKSYFEVRAEIEASGRDARWEFDRKKLFEKTKYMASIAQDLHDIAQVSGFETFEKFLVSLDSNFKPG